MRGFDYILYALSYVLYMYIHVQYTVEENITALVVNIYRTLSSPPDEAVGVSSNTCGYYSNNSGHSTPDQPFDLA